MNFLEKDLEDILFSTDSDLLYDRGLPIYQNRKRQLRVGNYGVLDMLAYSRDKLGPYDLVLKIQVIELKKETINFDTFLQSVKYAKGIVRYLKLRNKSVSFDIEIILIGKTINLNSSLVYLSDLIYSEGCNSISSINFFTYDYKIDGLYFQRHSEYCLIDEGFKI